jgi:hypothetical protein
MARVTKLAKRQRVRGALIALVDALPDRLRTRPKSDRDWHRIYNKIYHGKLPALPPEVAELIGVRKVDLAEEDRQRALRFYRARIVALLRAWLIK